MDFADWSVVAVLIAASLALAYCLFARESRKLGRLADALGGENRSSILGGNYVKLDCQGAELHIRLMPSSSDSGHGPQLIILRKTPPAFRMHISSSSWAARLGTAIGLLDDVAVGDPAIDQRYRIKASDKGEAIAFVNDPQRREALAYFFDQGFTDIILGENDVCVIKPQDHKTDLDASRMRQHLEHFAVLFPQRKISQDSEHRDYPDRSTDDVNLDRR